MTYFYEKENASKVRRLLEVMLPVIITQLAIMGMNFFDASMSGQAGNVDLAGAAIGGNIWMPLQTGISGVLMAAMPISAHLIGAGKKHEVSVVIRHGLMLAAVFAFLLVLAGAVALPLFLNGLGLEPAVYHVAYWYTACLGIGVLPFFMLTPLRNFIDTLGYTKLTMKIYLLALPINALLNYVLIFGKLGLPALGGIGAGLATGLTFWILFALYAWVLTQLSPFREYAVLGFVKPELKVVLEYLRLGVPTGISIFMETSIFGVVAFLVAKFGTNVIAAHQAALNFASLVYMLPLSFSIALTIIIGIEAGAKRYAEARAYTYLGLQLSMTCAVFYIVAGALFSTPIGRIYSEDREVIELIKHFLIYAFIWQAGDSIAAPIQGILRGYKDVTATFWASMLAYWGICLPVGLLLDYVFQMGAFAYWNSLDFGVLTSALLLVLRLRWLQKRIDRGAY